MDMNKEAGKAFHRNLLNISRNTDGQAQKLRQRYDGNLRKQPVDAATKTLKAQNAALKAELAKLKEKK